MVKNVFFFVFLFGWSSHLFAQSPWPKNYFQQPVGFPIILSGTFGELRGGHFHSGIDIKTNGAEGAKIYAVADGYVSRIKVSPYGFGKAVYINHPNGFTSVYGHLRSFNNHIDDYVRKQQIKRKSFSVDLYLNSEEISVKKGDVIALSGNTGSSAGPHLHFELRETAGQVPVNPLLFGYNIRDFITPTIQSIRVFPMNRSSLVNNQNVPASFEVQGWGKTYRLKNIDTISVSGNIALGISVHDLLNDAPNKNGIYAVKLFIDNNLAYAHQFDRFTFTESAYINSMIDYACYIENETRFQMTCRKPGNRLKIYTALLNEGVFEFNDNKVYQLRYEVSDFAGNVSILSFVLRSVYCAADMYAVPYEESAYFFAHNSDNHFQNERAYLTAPKGSFYEDFFFQYNQRESDSLLFSPVCSLHRNTLPMHGTVTLGIKPDSNALKFQGNLCLVRFESDKAIYAGGKFVNGFVESQISTFGDYAVSCDTVPPDIRFVSFSDKSTVQVGVPLKVKISDNFSGISDYSPELNSNWIIMEYDPKTQLLVYYPDENLKNGENTFKLTVSDKKGNSSVKKLTFNYQVIK